jgi:hypothetical protein
MMPAWVAFLGMIVSGCLALLSHLAVKRADQTGRVTFFFWRLATRSEDAWFFNRKQKFDAFRTIFLAAASLLFAAYFLEAMGAFDR